jgi:hypothetical protein
MTSSKVAEVALAHVVGDEVEAVYRRDDLFEKCRHLMDAWAIHCAAAQKSGILLRLSRRGEGA